MRWTPEARLAQAQKIKAQKPWLHSTGPRTPAGKARVARNAIQHGNRSRSMKRFHHLLRVQSMFLKLYALKQSISCHPEQSEGSQSTTPMRSFAVAQDDKIIRLHHEAHEAFTKNPSLLRDLRDLRGKNLSCSQPFTTPNMPCHLDKP